DEIKTSIEMESIYNLIDIDKKKGYIGALAGLFLLVACATWYNWLVGFVFGFLFTLVGFVKVKAHTNKSRIALNVLAGLVVIVITWIGSLAMLNVVGRMGVSFNKLILNFMIMILVCLFIMVFTGNWRSALIIGTLLLLLLCLANGFIYQFRGKELAPLDFMSIKTAVNVAGQYTPRLTPSMFYGIVSWILSVFLLFCFPSVKVPKCFRMRMVYLVADFLLLVCLLLTTTNIQIKLWDSQGTRLNGYFLNFFLEIRSSAVNKPKDYSPDRVRDIVKKHSDVNENAIKVQNYPNPPMITHPEQTEPQPEITENTPHKEQTYPNIIVIMDESFADFRILGDNFNTDKPVTPFIDSLNENTIKGYALASVFGGNTANSEFEFLTGHSMAFLPDNSVPYQQYINGEIYSVPWVLRSYGYRCVATHPYFASGWSREKIYPYLGFDESTFIDSYTEPEIIREYVSDMETFEYMLDTLSSKETDEPLFLFGITMQNHGGYTYSGEDFVPEIKLAGYSAEYPTVEQYLTLANKTDTAVEYLITELSEYGEDTLVLFFGDHFPSLNGNFYNEVHGGTYVTTDEKMLKYKMPFFIWANYDIPEDFVECTSLNYLSVHLMNTAGITLPPFFEFLGKCEKAIPAMNAFGFASVTNEAFVPFSEASPVEKDWIEEYSVLQYNNLIDSKNRDEIFSSYISFGQDIPTPSEADSNIIKE
ncbi:MAG: sulfatase-like hydrolase/transferase, partial [Clostridia bacterium]|nr:sulfatase-like hydrolase/transferase [Clostridia bacterium]